MIGIPAHQRKWYPSKIQYPTCRHAFPRYFCYVTKQDYVEQWVADLPASAVQSRWCPWIPPCWGSVFVIRVKPEVAMKVILDPFGCPSLSFRSHKFRARLSRGLIKAFGRQNCCFDSRKSNGRLTTVGCFEFACKWTKVQLHYQQLSTSLTPIFYCNFLGIQVRIPWIY